MDGDAEVELDVLVQAVWERANSDGGLNGLIALTSPAAKALLERLPGYAKFLDLRHELDETITLPARGMLEFGPEGWAISDNLPLPTLKAALDRVDAGAGPREAEQVLVHGWADNPLFKHLDRRVRQLVPPEDELRPIFEARADLVERAVEHHGAGRYDASVPILLAQTDGLMQDTVNKDFFSKATDSRAFIDDETLAGLDGALSVARTWYSRDLRPSQISGGCSRHGVLHGRELGYATQTNSTKALALLAAVVDICRPKLAAQAGVRMEAQAGSDKTDESGRRRDRRGFSEARALLSRLESALLQHLGPTGTFPPIEQIDWPTDLPLVVLELSADAQRWWAWTQAETGWVFGRAGSLLESWFYDGPVPPQHAPWASDAEGWASIDDPPPPNWPISEAI